MGTLLTPQSFLRAPRPSSQWASSNGEARSPLAGPRHRTSPQPPRQFAAGRGGGKLGANAHLAWEPGRQAVSSRTSQRQLKREHPFFVQAGHHRHWWQLASSVSALSDRSSALPSASHPQLCNSSLCLGLVLILASLSRGEVGSDETCTVYRVT